MQDITKRLNKVIWQINWINKMIDSGDDCEKIIVQFQAVKWALDKAFSELLNTKLNSCLTQKDELQIKKILELITK